MTVAFLHIPKAAGTSYLEALGHALGGERFVADIPGNYSSEAFQHQLDPESLRRYSFVAGHFDYGVCRRAPFLRPTTVLRDPVDRIVSWYHYTLRSGDAGLEPWRRFIEGRDLSVEEFLLHPRLQRLHGQAQTVQIAGYLWSGDPIPTVEQVAAEAEANLAGFAHFGLYERLGDSLRLAQAELGLADVPTLPDRNVSPARPNEIDPAVRELIGGRLGMDSAFYRGAVGAFDARLAAHGLSGQSTRLEPPVRPGPVSVTSAVVRQPEPSGVEPYTSPASDAGGRPTEEDDPTQEDEGRESWLEVVWYPVPGEALGGHLTAPLPLEARGAATTCAGSALRVEAHDHLDLGANWVRVDEGLYQVQATVPCRRFEGDEPVGDWSVLFAFGWFATPPIPFVDGLPGAPDVELWRTETVPLGMPPLPLLGVPTTAGGLLRVPADGGHLCISLGASAPLVVSPGDRAHFVYAKIG